MSFRDIVPWRGLKKNDSLSRRDEYEDAFLGLQKHVNDLFDNFFSGSGFGIEPLMGRTFTPKVDVVETDEAIMVKAELPGMDEKEIDVSVNDDSLVLKGEKKEEKEEKKGGFHRVERSYGSFYRRIAIPAEVDAEKVEASYKNGVLTVNLPKTGTGTTKKIKLN